MNELLDQFSKELLINKDVFRKLDVTEKGLDAFDELINVTNKIRSQTADEIDSSYFELYKPKLI